jgi:hypothetical protein
MRVVVIAMLLGMPLCTILGGLAGVRRRGSKDFGNISNG